MPVAAAGATVAVRLTLPPAATEELDEVSEVVVGVVPVAVPVPVLGNGSQNPLQPPRTTATVRTAALREGVAGRAGQKVENMVKLPFTNSFICGVRQRGLLSEYADLDAGNQNCCRLSLWGRG